MFDVCTTGETRSRDNGGTYCKYADLKARIAAAVENSDAPMLTRVWQELEYRIDVCRVTRSAPIEHLSLSKKNVFSFRVTCEQLH
jgi:hypothetical protein